MTNKPKNVGRAFEHRIVAHAAKAGVPAQRQPGSGVHASMPKDVVLDDRVLVEAKLRAVSVTQRGNRMLSIDLDWYRSVQEAATKHEFDQGILVVGPKGDRKPLVVCDLDWLLSLLAVDRLFDAAGSVCDTVISTDSET